MFVFPKKEDAGFSRQAVVYSANGAMLTQLKHVLLSQFEGFRQLEVPSLLLEHSACFVDSTSKYSRKLIEPVLSGTTFRDRMSD